MNKTKLEVIRINEDVIATSIVTNACSENMLVYKTPGGEVKVFENGATFPTTKYDNKSTPSGNNWIKNSSALQNGYYYHCDNNGNIIGLCGTWNNDSNYDNPGEIYSAHNIIMD